MEKDPKQAQGSGQPAKPAQQPPETPPVDRNQEYQAQVAKLNQRAEEAWAVYYKKTGIAYNAYQDTMREVYAVDERKASTQAPERTPEESLRAYKADRLKGLNTAAEAQAKVLAAEQNFVKARVGFWGDVHSAIADAVKDFWEWLVGWWEEPPVEGGGRRHMFGDPAWRTTFDPYNAVSYLGWNYGENLY